MRKKCTILLLLMFCISLLFGCTNIQNAPVSTTVLISAETQINNNYIEATVVSVIDGDTMWVLKNGVKTKIRLIGVDTPESVHTDDTKNNQYGVLASDFTKEQFKLNSKVYLEYDVETTDQYGRELVYLYFMDSNNNLKMYNKELLENGYANTMSIKPNIKYKDEFLKIELKAKLKKIGFWQYASELNWR